MPNTIGYTRLHQNWHCHGKQVADNEETDESTEDEDIDITEDELMRLLEEEDDDDEGMELEEILDEVTES